MQLTRRALWLFLPTVLLLAAGAWWDWSALLALGWLLLCGAVLMADWRMTPDGAGDTAWAGSGAAGMAAR